MKFNNVILQLNTTGFDICNVDDYSLLARFCDAYDFSEVDVNIEDNNIAVYDKYGRILMSVKIYMQDKENNNHDD